MHGGELEVLISALYLHAKVVLGHAEVADAILLVDPSLGLGDDLGALIADGRTVVDV